MNLRLIVSTTLLSLAISGCGGGGGTTTATDASSAPAEQPQVADTLTPDPEVASDTAPNDELEAVTATEELTASSDFAMGSSVDVDIDINVLSLNNDSGYLSICAALDDTNPDYANCFLQTRIPEATYAGTLRLSSALQVAYSAIWFLDMSRPAIVNKHQLVGSRIDVRL